VIVAIAVVPEINTIGVVGAIVVALAMVGAAADLAKNPEQTTFSLIVKVPKEPDVEDPRLIFVVDPEAPPVPILISFVTPEALMPPCMVVIDAAVVPPTASVAVEAKALNVALPSIEVVNVGAVVGANPEIDAPAGIVTVPVKVGDAIGANPEIDAPAGIVTVPVNVGEATGALVPSCV
jgi:hypothetical protein